MKAFAFILLWLFVEGAGVPLLSEGAFGPLAFLVHSNHVNVVTAYTGAWAAMSLGNVLGFTLFRRYGALLLDKLSARWPFVAAKRRQMEKKASASLFIAISITRFTGFGTFQLVLWLAGALRAPWSFLAYLCALNLVWTAVWLFGSHWLISLVMPFLRDLHAWQLALVGAVVLAILWWAHCWLDRRKRQAELSTENSDA